MVMFFPLHWVPKSIVTQNMLMYPNISDRSSLEFSIFLKFIAQQFPDSSANFDWKIYMHQLKVFDSWYLGKRIIQINSTK